MNINHIYILFVHLIVIILIIIIFDRYMSAIYCVKFTELSFNALYNESHGHV